MYRIIHKPLKKASRSCSLELKKIRLVGARQPLRTVLDDRLLDTTVLRERHVVVGADANHEDVGAASGESVAHLVAHVDQVEATGVLLLVDDGAHTALVVSSGDHDEVADLELEELDDRAGLEVNAQGVAGLDIGVDATDGATVVGNGHADLLGAEEGLLHPAELVSRLLSGDLVRDETTLGVVQQTEVLVRAVKRNHVHETDGICDVGAHLAVDADNLLHHDQLDLVVRQGVFETVPQKQHQGKALRGLVRSWGWLRSVATTQLVQKPVRRRVDALHMLLYTATLRDR
ncbi:argonaute 12, putative [Babesia ovata]|uniref:Argonaute 12, putative n=1 Tax=Babesia ovata TaxID=189622 RepID=A0A2H6K762_9APIC|nr:argonaute 12, putative [Babesia ovata]GBE58808.1 argonaute 12, putative [Babesia ovata]